MATDLRELAFFGGWVRTSLSAGAAVVWGNPYQRNREFAVASGTASVRLPRPQLADTKLGVEYIIVNAGPGSLVVQDGDEPFTGSPPVPNDLLTLASGKVCRATLVSKSPETWVLRSSFRSRKVGSVIPTLTYAVDYVQNAANPVLLQQIINQGYDGTAAAYVRCTVRSGVLIGSAFSGLESFLTGDTVSGISWFAGSLLLLTVEDGAKIGGWGGTGGRAGVPGTGSDSGAPGQAGGKACRLTIPTRIIVAPRGEIFGGGGGGGGGGSSGVILTIFGGGGGGGRGIRMTQAGGLLPNPGGGSFGTGQAGTAGAVFSAGGGGLGAGTGGNGGNGGFGATPGNAGSAAPSWGSGGAGGAAGAAISYSAGAGAPTILSGASQILGTTILE